MRAADKPITTLIADLTRETSSLVQQEVKLAKAELSEKISQVGTGATSMVSGGAVLYAGFLVLLLALTIGLDQFLSQWTDQHWIAPLIVGLIVAIIGLVMVQKGRHNLEAENLTPHRTARSLRRDRSFIREEMK